MSESFAVSMKQQQDFQFLVNFDQEGVSELLTDEAPPLGAGKGPNPARILAAAVGNCLAASLLFCLRKSHIDVRGMNAVVEGTMVRNEKGRFRIGEMRVRIEPTLDPADVERMARCNQLFEDFCIVTESVRAGIRIDVAVEPAGAGPDETRATS